MRSLLVAIALLGCPASAVAPAPPPHDDDEPQLWEGTCFWAVWESQPCQHSA